jgi:nucleotide-binding universal stress UspA family protein
VAGLRSFERKCKKAFGAATFTRLATPLWLPDALNGMAEKQGADLVIMGAHGGGGNPLFGSVSTDVAVKSKIPVVLVPGAWEPSPIKRIMLAHDGGPMDRHALPPLLRLAKRKKAEVIVAHVRGNIIAFDSGMDRRAFKDLLPGIPVSFVASSWLWPSTASVVSGRACCIAARPNAWRCIPMCR